MSHSKTSRRDFLKTSTAAASAATLPLWISPDPARAFASPNERPVVGCIGTGSRWGQIVSQAMNYGDVATVCDVDANHAGAAAKRCRDAQGKKGDERTVDIHEDYRKVLERDDVDVVTIVTPDHWHSKIAIEAMRAGKDIYCEKPLTLTIDEGRKIVSVLDEAKRVFQVGTQQRSEYFDGKKRLYRFLHGVAMVREGRIGKVKRVTCAIGGSSDSGPIPVAEPPEGLNWEKWLGQAPLVDFRYSPGGRWGKSRCHYEFRRQDDRLGGPPCGYRPVGHRYGEFRPGFGGRHRDASLRIRERASPAGRPLQCGHRLPCDVHVPQRGRADHSARYEERHYL